VIQPLPGQLRGLSVQQFCLAVVGFQGVDALHGRLYIRMIAGAHAWEERLLFVVSVSRRRDLKVLQRRFQRFALFAIQCSAGRTIDNADHHVEKSLDPAMTVAEQPERLVKPVVRPGSKFHWHNAPFCSSVKVRECPLQTFAIVSEELVIRIVAAQPNAR
jgi:hypothetical protein